MGDNALRAAREMATGLDPHTIATHTGAKWDEDTGEFALSFLGSPVSITYPAYEVSIADRPSPPHIAALLVYYLALSDGTQPSDTLISFAGLPEASFYVTAFHGYTGARIARHFALDAAALPGAVERLGGASISGLGDQAWTIPALPKVPITLLWWNADDEFEARAELLFDETASHHLTTDGCAVLGSWLTSLLVGNG